VVFADPSGSLRDKTSAIFLHFTLVVKQNRRRYSRNRGDFTAFHPANLQFLANALQSRALRRPFIPQTSVKRLSFLEAPHEIHDLIFGPIPVITVTIASTQE